MTGKARHVLGVGSGKGGVGKSTVSLNLALALRERGRAVGVLDADLHGPNLPLMLGITRHRWTDQWTLARKDKVRLQPVERHGLQVMSAGFILGEDQPLKVDGMTARALIMQLLHETAWGDLDYLVIDLPPGTGDIQQAILRELSLGHAIIVVTPQYMAHLDARKAVRMYRDAQVPVLGAIENMAGFVCPHCGESLQVFPPVPEDRSVWSMEVERLGTIPLDPALSLASDTGRALLIDQPGSAQAEAFRRIAEGVEDRLVQA